MLQLLYLLLLLLLLLLLRLSGLGLASLPARVRGLVGRGHGRVQRGELAHHLLVRLLLVRVHGLRVLPQVVEARELLPTVARERALAGVFSVFFFVFFLLSVR